MKLMSGIALHHGGLLHQSYCHTWKNFIKINQNMHVVSEVWSMQEITVASTLHVFEPSQLKPVRNGTGMQY